MRYDTDRETLMLSAQELCLLSLRRGDLDAKPRTLSKELLSPVSWGRICAEAGASYQQEVSFYYHLRLGELSVGITAEADGLYRNGQGEPVVDLVRPIGERGVMAPPCEELLGELRLCILGLCAEKNLPEGAGRITLVSADGKQIRHFFYRFPKKVLEAFALDVLRRIEHRVRLAAERERELLPRAAEAAFPYRTLREGQEWMIRDGFDAIKKGKRLFAEAPTGTGKTISALYPAVRALGKGYVEKIFYLTAKSSTRREAFGASKALFSSGVPLRSVIITAKEQACLCAARLVGKEGNLCNRVDCELFRGYYDRREGAIRELLSRANGFPPSLIREVAQKHRICPYELSLDLSELCDVIICDYNYVFDPSVYFRRYFSSEAGKSLPPYVFLVDEAHNLADRAREMYSASLRSSSWEALAEVLPPNGSALGKAVERLSLSVRGLRRLLKDTLTKNDAGEEQGFYLDRSLPPALLEELDIFRKAAGEWLRVNRADPLYDTVERLVGEMRKFLLVAEYFDSRFLFYLELSAGEMHLREYCLDPSYIMNKTLSRAKSALLFSATLTPTDYFVDILGGGKEAERVSLPSPFDPDRLCLAAVDFLSVRFEDRKKNAASYATVIAATVSAKAGNYIAYFPSYEILESVHRAFVKKYPKVKTVVQKRNMDLREKEAFLDSFPEDMGRLRIGFCVLGGLFSEGVDLPGSRLIGSIIFGVGIPALSNERNILKEYFDGKCERGYDYAYTYPGMNRVLQAAGRVIRREEDRGVVVLVDDRYAAEPYLHLFPEHWRGLQYAGNFRSLAEIVRRFWEKPDFLP